MPTEAEIRQWIRDEREKVRQEEQSSCLHLKSGTLHEDGTVTCDQCNKALVWKGKE